MASVETVGNEGVIAVHCAAVWSIGSPPARSMPTVCEYQSLPLRKTTLPRICASEVSSFRGLAGHWKVATGEPGTQFCGRRSPPGLTQPPPGRTKEAAGPSAGAAAVPLTVNTRSEERRVGKEGGTR